MLPLCGEIKIIITRNAVNCFSQVHAFMVLTIIGSGFAAGQFVIAAAGAGTMDYGEYREQLGGGKHTNCDPEYHVDCKKVMQLL